MFERLPTDAMRLIIVMMIYDDNYMMTVYSLPVANVIACELKLLNTPVVGLILMSMQYSCCKYCNGFVSDTQSTNSCCKHVLKFVSF